MNYTPKTEVSTGQFPTEVNPSWELSYSERVKKHLEDGSDPTSFAQALIVADRGDLVVKNIGMFIGYNADTDNMDGTNKGGDAFAVAKALIEGGLGQFVHGETLTTLLGTKVDPINLAELLVNGGIAGGYPYIAVYSYSDFIKAGADPTALAKMYIEKGQAHPVLERLEDLQKAGAEIDTTALIEQLVEQGKGLYVLVNINKFLGAGVVDFDFNPLYRQVVDAGNARYLSDPGVLANLQRAGVRVDS